MTTRYANALSVSAWTQSVETRAGRRFLSVGKILILGLDFSSLSSFRSCFVRLFLQCSLPATMFFSSFLRNAKSLSSRSGFSRGGFQSVGTYNLGLKSLSGGQLAKSSQKSWICKSNWASLESRSEGLSFRPMPRTLNLVLRALFPGFEMGREKALAWAGQSVVLIGWLIQVTHVRKWPNENNLCVIAKSKWRKACPPQRRFLDEIQFAGYVVVLIRVAICFEHLERPAYLKICIRKFIKPVAML